MIYSCNGLDITTIEGIGDKKSGYHPLQARLAHFNGSQCGFCSPGMVMNMYSLMEAKNGDLTMKEIENSFGGNICRCTGYRPILDAFKSFASDASEELKNACSDIDIEDLVKICPKTGANCAGSCKSVLYNKLDFDFKDGRQWINVYNLDKTFEALANKGSRPYMLVAGNTAHGVYRRPDNLEVFIDVSGVAELMAHELSNEKLTIGGGITLAEAFRILNDASRQNSSFQYCAELAKHIDLVANVPIRNTGTIAGNLMIKHQHHEFISDIFLILESVGATVTLRE